MEKKKQKLKSPSDYPLFSFRTTAKEKQELMREIEQVKRQMRQSQGSDERLINKNDVIVEALRRGLKAMKQGNK